MISVVIDLADALPRMSASIQGFSRAFGRAARDGAVLEYDGVVASVAPAIPFRSIFNSAAFRDSGNSPLRSRGWPLTMGQPASPRGASGCTSPIRTGSPRLKPQGSAATRSLRR